MSYQEKLNTPGEHTFYFQGAVGQLEAILMVPEQANTRYMALLGHPHSLQGGTMHNKVITTMARAFKELGIASVRFNFRGVGQSAGTYDAGQGESEDLLLLAQQLQLELSQMNFIFAGFSFGSYVAYRAAAQYKHILLITIAPPIHHYDYFEFSPAPMPWVIMQGDEDEIVPLQLVRDFAAQSIPPLPLVRFAQTTHFFHGKLIELKAQLIELVLNTVTLL